MDIIAYFCMPSSSPLQPKAEPIPTTVTLKQTADAISSYLSTLSSMGLKYPIWALGSGHVFLSWASTFCLLTASYRVRTTEAGPETLHIHPLTA